MSSWLSARFVKAVIYIFASRKAAMCAAGEPHIESHRIAIAGFESCRLSIICSSVVSKCLSGRR
jgi:hypothetical protein